VAVPLNVRFVRSDGFQRFLFRLGDGEKPLLRFGSVAARGSVTGIEFAATKELNSLELF